MKKAVLYGAGNIGRGFIGQLFSESGYEVIFIDVANDLVNKLNEDKSYPVKIITAGSDYEIIVDNVRAINGMDHSSIAEEISGADIMATAVGVNNLRVISAFLANGLKKRWEYGNFNPLNIIICENLINANHVLKEQIAKHLAEDERDKLDELVGFVEASIGRMVPIMTPEMQQGNKLRICVEEYCELPVDKDGFKGKIPQIRNMTLSNPFEYVIQKKLFIHNMGHAVAAYLGFLNGYHYIWEAIGDIDINNAVRAAMLESGRALTKEHDISREQIKNYIDDLLRRFANPKLGDTIERVGKDLPRKLSSGDRLVGALNLCMKNGIESKSICMGISAALCFKDSAGGDDLSIVDAYGPDGVLESVCKLSKATIEWSRIINYYYAIRLDFKEILRAYSRLP